MPGHRSIQAPLFDERFVSWQEESSLMMKGGSGDDLTQNIGTVLLTAIRIDD